MCFMNLMVIQSIHKKRDGCFYNQDRDPRTKTGWYRTERFDPGPRTEPNQNRKKSRNLGLARTRTEKNLEILDQLGPGPRKISNPGTGPGPRKFSKSRTGPDQSGAKRSGAQRSGAERSGEERSGAERSGAERSGEEKR